MSSVFRVSETTSSEPLFCLPIQETELVDPTQKQNFHPKKTKKTKNDKSSRSGRVGLFFLPAFLGVEAYV